MNNHYQKISSGLLRYGVFLLLLVSAAGCVNPSGTQCQKCIDNKPAPTEFSTAINEVNHVISGDQAVTMTRTFQSSADSLRLGSLANVDHLLPYYETFNLKAIDTLLCQQNSVGFRIYLGMDNHKQLRFVLVGVDPSGQDLISRRVANPRGRMAGADNGEVAIDAGQRWP